MLGKDGVFQAGREFGDIALQNIARLVIMLTLKVPLEE
jgi:hypothetical protein